MKNISHLVGLSGGKDSSVMALRLKEVEPRDYVYFCTPTGDELPEMNEHWRKLSKLLGQPIIMLHDPEYPTIFDLIKHFGAMPNFRQRWCTRILKIETAQQFYNLVKPAVIYVGLRADEEDRKGNSIYDADIKQRYPLREWGWDINKVWDYLNHNNIEIPRRTDCAMCFYQRIGEWWWLWKDHSEYFQRISDLEDEIGHTLMTPSKHKIWPHKLSDLAIEFKNGRMPREIRSNRQYQCRICNI